MVGLTQMSPAFSRPFAQFDIGIFTIQAKFQRHRHESRQTFCCKSAILRPDAGCSGGAGFRAAHLDPIRRCDITFR